MSFAALAKISDYIDNKNENLPIGINYSDSVFYKEFVRLFKIFTFYTEMNSSAMNSRSSSMNSIFKQPLKCFLSTDIELLKKLGNTSYFNLCPNILYMKDTPIHGIRLKKDISNLMENTFNTNGINSVIFTSQKLSEIYNITNKKVYKLQLPVDNYWSGVRDATSKIVINCNLPVKQGMVDVQQMNNLTNTYKASILGNLINEKRWRSSTKEIFLKSKCIVNISYCDSDIYMLLLAASCGCPIVSFPNMFIEEVFGDTAIYINNISELSRYSSIDLTKKAKQQQEIIKQNYSKPELINTWNDVFYNISKEIIC